jgi:hypothetical protein
LPQYYFDIETVPLDEYRNDVGASFDPCKAKIISIQYQRLDSAGGEQLLILKEWEAGSSERAIVEQFKQVFLDKGIWEFVLVGNNLAFECKFMKYKLRQYCGLEGLKLGHRPMIDLKHILIVANYRFVASLGAAPFIPFKKNAIPNANGSNAWRKMYHYFMLKYLTLCKVIQDGEKVYVGDDLEMDMAQSLLSLGIKKVEMHAGFLFGVDGKEATIESDRTKGFFAQS